MDPINSWKKIHKKGHIPSFFREYWGAKHASDPFEEEKEYENLQESANRAMTAGLILGIMLFVGLAVFILGTLFMAANHKDTSPAFTTISGLTIILGGLGMLVMFQIAKKRDPAQKKGRWHFEEFYRETWKFFILFKIQPNEVLGQMSKEEFMKCIADSLRSVAANHVEPKCGFERTAAMADWTKMHSAALRWALCKREYGNYFPAPTNQDQNAMPGTLKDATLGEDEARK